MKAKWRGGITEKTAKVMCGANCEEYRTLHIRK